MVLHETLVKVTGLAVACMKLKPSVLVSMEKWWKTWVSFGESSEISSKLSNWQVESSLSFKMIETGKNTKDVSITAGVLCHRNGLEVGGCLRRKKGPFGTEDFLFVGWCFCPRCLPRKMMGFGILKCQNLWVLGEKKNRGFFKAVFLVGGEALCNQLVHGDFHGNLRGLLTIGFL